MLACFHSLIMASSSFSSQLFFLFTALVLFSASLVTAAKRPRALVLPVTKDAATQQYVARVSQRTPLVPVNLVVDLGGRHLWVDCDKGFVSSTYRPVRCRSSLCSLASADGCGDCFSGPRPGCNNNTCGVSPENPFIRTSTSGELAQDVIALQSTNGANPGPVVKDPNFLFACGPTFLLKGLARGATGIAGLGRNRAAPPLQLAAAFSFKRSFAICLSSSTKSAGVIFFGDGPYKFLPGLDASQSLIYTPLIKNPVSTAGTFTKGEPSYEYFIKVTSIKVNGEAVPLNSTLLSIENNGVGGTKIGTVQQYTVLESSIYKAVTEAFSAALSKVPRAAPVKPFSLCFPSSALGSTRVGPAVPSIDLVLQDKNTFWRIFGSNSMVEAKSGVMCLGFIDGGVNPRTSIVIGGHQIEDNLLQFDLSRSRLGFTSTLLFRQTTCANFNFTAAP